ncbi:helix-turn-helix domain-containing protein [Azospirillum halopraeferens]|uniref:helix-turn-helix domain-containing protein n=1 Tax=Azospirillum halopraeferens TaxID=34010 RepID=UPI000415D0AB|nr:helix-turn-helix domain-containing protein [Azospirillum halopraeferens]
MLRILPPARPLTPYVDGYWFVRDLPGRYAGQPIRTGPQPVAAVSVQFGQPNTGDDGRPVPAVSLLGLQTRTRLWRSGPDTDFVMVRLRLPGLALLFPHTGSAGVDALLDLGTIVGDGAARRLAAGLPAAGAPERVAAALDRWLLTRLETAPQRESAARFAAACARLRRDGRVDAAAATACVSPRQLQRWLRDQAGLSPRQLFDLHRLQASLRAVQAGDGDPLDGYSDQAHQIRSWRRRLGVTPGRYARARPSALAELAGRAGGFAAEDGVFYL